MAIYIHHFDDEVICHGIISAGLQAKALKGCNILELNSVKTFYLSVAERCG